MSMSPMCLYPFAAHAAGLDGAVGVISARSSRVFQSELVPEKIQPPDIRATPCAYSGGSFCWPDCTTGPERVVVGAPCNDVVPGLVDGVPELEHPAPASATRSSKHRERFRASTTAHRTTRPDA